MDTENMQSCISCGKVKELAGFRRDKNQRLGRERRCKQCKSLRKPFVQRFWSRVNKDGPLHSELGTQCWDWVAARHPRGYGQIWAPTLRRVIGAHRVSWFLSHGTWAPDCCLHRCDRPQCVRPDHLFVGSQLDNIADRHTKGRTRHGVVCGEKAHNSKLREQDVVEIRALLEQGTSCTSLAGRFQVSRGHIQAIGRRDCWRHLG